MGCGEGLGPRRAACRCLDVAGGGVRDTARLSRVYFSIDGKRPSGGRRSEPLIWAALALFGSASLQGWG